MNKIIAATLALAVISLAVIPTRAAAFWPFDGFGNNNSDSTSTFPTLIQNIIDHFSLNADEVQTVIDETRTQEREQRQLELQDRLSQAVSDGTLTEDQKNELLQMHTEWQTQLENSSDLTPEERREQADQHREQIESWAEENGIDLSVIHEYGFSFGHGMHMGPRMGM